jgi:uncharacterized membrane protein HdeD (DUF308 family)
MDAHQPLFALPELHRRWKTFFALGILLVALGVVGVCASTFTTLLSVVFLGVLLLMAGGAVVAHAFSAPRWSGFFLHLLAGLLYVVVGWLCVTRPGLQAIVLTLLLAISLVVQGGMRMGAALVAHVDGRGVLFVSGLLSLLLGIMIWNQWPISGLWVIGLFVGIDLAFYGLWLVSLAQAVRHLASAA